MVEPGCNLDVLRDAAAEHGLTFGPDPATHDRNTLGGMIGNNSCGVHSVIAEFYGPGPLTVDQVVELDVLTYDGHRITVGATSDEELDRIVPGTPRGPASTGVSSTCATGTSTRSGRGSPTSPGGCRASTSTVCSPSTASTSVKRWSAPRAPASSCCTPRSGSSTPCRPARSSSSATPMLAAAADVPVVREHRPVGLEGIDAKLVEYMRRKGLHPATSTCSPKATRSCSSSSAETTSTGPTREPRRSPPTARGRCPEHEGVRGSVGGAEALAGPRVGPRRHRPGSRHAREPPGLGGRRRPAGAGRRLPPRLPGAARRVRLRRRALRPLRPGLHPLPHRLHARHRARCAPLAGVPRRAADLVVSYGGSLSGEHGDGQAAPRCSRRCTARSWSGRSPSSRTSGTRRTMNPGRSCARTRPMRTSASDPTRGCVGPRPISPSPTTTSTSPTRLAGVSVSASVATWIGHHVPELHGDPGRGGLHPRPGPDALRAPPGRRARRLARRRRRRHARPLPRVQGLQDRLPGERRHGHLQGRVPLAPLRGRLRPRVGYSMGLIYWWARAGEPPPSAGEPRRRCARSRPAGEAGRRGGLAARHPPVRAPRFAARSRRLAGRTSGGIGPVAPPPRGTAPSLSDTGWCPASGRREPPAPTAEGVPSRPTGCCCGPTRSTTTCAPRVLAAAVDVLKHAGYRSRSRPDLCAVGGPSTTSGCLRPPDGSGCRPSDAAPGDPCRCADRRVGAELVAAFRDELMILLPPRRGRPAPGPDLAALGVPRAPALPAARPTPGTLVHRHCHHQAVMGTDAEPALLKRMGVDAETADGLLRDGRLVRLLPDHYEVSIRVGERKLLPGAPQLETTEIRRHRRLQLPGADRAVHRPTDADAHRRAAPTRDRPVVGLTAPAVPAPFRGAVDRVPLRRWWGSSCSLRCSSSGSRSLGSPVGAFSRPPCCFSWRAWPPGRSASDSSTSRRATARLPCSPSSRCSASCSRTGCAPGWATCGARGGCRVGCCSSACRSPSASPRWLPACSSASRGPSPCWSRRR